MPRRLEHMGFLTDVVPLGGLQTARALAVAIGLLLVYLGAGLRRGKREAWWLAVVLAGASIVVNLLKGVDVDAAAISAIVLAMLVTSRAEFPAAADRRRRSRALLGAVGFAVAGYAVGLTDLVVRRGHVAAGQPAARWLVEVAYGMVGVTGPLRFTNPASAGALAVTTATMGCLVAAVAVVLLLRPAAGRPGHSAEDAVRLRSLLDTHGAGDSLGYFALREDKSLIFSPSGKAAIAYRVIAGVCLASGDPLGDPEAWPAAIVTWLAEARRHGWRPSVLGCSERAGEAYHRHGLDAIELGDEAIVDAATFGLEGRSMRGVRQAVGRVERAGYVCEIGRQADLDPAVVHEAARACDRFRDGDIERGFSMALSRIGDAADGDCLIVLARDRDGGVRGVLQFVPWGRDGLSLDVMRRDPNSDNGVVEYMVTSAVLWAAGHGIVRISLNFAALRSVFARADRLGAGPILRGWRRVLLIASRFWQIESLYRANAKYQPDWRPRFLCFPSMADLPRVGIAALRAEALLVTPRPWHWVHRRRGPRTVVPGVAESKLSITAVGVGHHS